MRQYPNEIAQAIGEVLEKKSMQITQLAQLSGVSSGYLSEVLSGKKGEQMGIHVLRRLAKGLGMSTTALVRRIELISQEINNAEGR
jgi:transcriptional regulator with XRE-family HTH domain